MPILVMAGIDEGWSMLDARSYPTDDVNIKWRYSPPILLCTTQRRSWHPTKIPKVCALLLILSFHSIFVFFVFPNVVIGYFWKVPKPTRGEAPVRGQTIIVWNIVGLFPSCFAFCTTTMEAKVSLAMFFKVRMGLFKHKETFLFVSELLSRGHLLSRSL